MCLTNDIVGEVVAAESRAGTLREPPSTYTTPVELTFLSISFVLIAVAAFASFIPALRATRIDPMVALRYQ